MFFKMAIGTLDKTYVSGGIDIENTLKEILSRERGNEANNWKARL